MHCAHTARYAGLAHSAQVVGTCRDLSPLPSPRPGRDIISRSRPPRQLSQVATSIPRHDLPSAQPKLPRSRPQKWGRDTNFHRAGRTMSRHHSGQSRSRHQNQVMTLLKATLCRDINFYVATSFLPTVDFPSHDQPLFPSQNALVATQNLGRDINSMSRHHGHCLLLRRQNRSSAQPGRDFHLWSRPHVQPNQVATS